VLCDPQSFASFKSSVFSVSTLTHIRIDSSMKNNDEDFAREDVVNLEL
jgi:hypothetical protein